MPLNRCFWCDRPLVVVHDRCAACGRFVETNKFDGTPSGKIAPSGHVGASGCVGASGSVHTFRPGDPAPIVVVPLEEVTRVERSLGRSKFRSLADLDAALGLDLNLGDDSPERPLGNDLVVDDPYAIPPSQPRCRPIIL